MSSRAVIYFSATGTTRKAAGMLAEAAGAELFEIVPKKPYSKADLNWMNPFSRSTAEMHNRSKWPEIEPLDLAPEKYDEIFLCFPIWWYVAPTIINVFLESRSFVGRKIVLFATSGGSGFGKTVEKLMPSAPGAEITEGKVLNRMKREDIEQWLKTAE